MADDPPGKPPSWERLRVLAKRAAVVLIALVLGGYGLLVVARLMMKLDH